MRALILAAALSSITVPAVAEDYTWLLPPAGLYCPAGKDVMPIRIRENGGMVIDGLACESVRLEGGRVWSRACVGNGAAAVDYDTDLQVSPSGALTHDGVRFQRRAGPAPCPGG